MRREQLGGGNHIDGAQINDRGPVVTSAGAKTSNQFSALLAFRDVRELTAADIVGAINHLYPSAQVAGWGGDQPAEGAHGILLSVNSVDMAVTHRKLPAPLRAFDGGNQPDFYWQNAKANIEQHKSHIFVTEAAAGESSRGVERADAITIVVDAISYLMQPMGVMWVRAKNLVRADHFAKLMEGFRAGRSLPAGLWVRLLVATLPPTSAAAGPDIVAGTFGLQCFGSPNIEIHSTRLSIADCMSAALSYAEAKLTTGQPTWNEATTTIEDGATFRIERADRGLFGVGPIAKLTDVTQS
jgi:hypothetical protein